MDRLHASAIPTSPSPSLFFGESTGADHAGLTESANGDRDHILAGVGDMPTAPIVVRHAAAVADGLGLAVTLARVVETLRYSGFPADPIQWQLRCNEGRNHLKQMEALETRPSVTMKSVLLAGEPAEALSSWAKTHDIAILALATGAQRTLAPAALGATAQRILAKGATSLLLVPASEAATRKVTYRKLMVPLDGSIRAESVLPLATRIARPNETEIVLVHVLPKLDLVGRGGTERPGSDMLARLAADNERRARDYLEQLSAKLVRQGAKVSTAIVTEGDPRAQLRRFVVERQIDLVVLSSNGQSGLPDVPCGSVTEYLASHAPTPLLIVSPNFAHGFGRSPIRGRAGAIAPTAIIPQ